MFKTYTLAWMDGETRTRTGDTTIFRGPADRTENWGSSRLLSRPPPVRAKETGSVLRGASRFPVDVLRKTLKPLIHARSCEWVWLGGNYPHLLTWAARSWLLPRRDRYRRQSRASRICRLRNQDHDRLALKADSSTRRAAVVSLNRGGKLDGAFLAACQRRAICMARRQCTDGSNVWYDIWYHLKGDGGGDHG